MLGRDLSGAARTAWRCGGDIKAVDQVHIARRNLCQQTANAPVNCPCASAAIEPFPRDRFPVISWRYCWALSLLLVLR
jgi:hypothetical protein